MDVEVLRQSLLEPEGRWRRVDSVTETGSTNADLVARAATEDIAGAVLLADRQTAGRGRQGRTWVTPPGSQIALSAGISVDGIPGDRWGWIPLLAGVAVVDAVAEVTGVRAGLKWPNDVLVDGRKLAGILAEVAAPASVVVLGLGLNVSLSPDDLPDPNATALSILGAEHLDRTALAGAILRQLGVRIEHWREAQGADERLADDYRSRSVTLGSRVRAELPGYQEILGTAVGIADSGQLQVDTGDGTVTIAAGDITHLRAQ